MSTTTHLMTAEELMNVDDDSHRHELIKGELLTMPFFGEEHGAVTATLMAMLGLYVKANDLGVVFARTGYKLETNPDTVLGPDISFRTKDRVGTIKDDYFCNPPDLAIEVRYSRENPEQRAEQWLAFATKSVWLVILDQRLVEVISATGERKLFEESDELMDDTVPGFRVRVSEIFD